MCVHGQSHEYDRYKYVCAHKFFSTVSLRYFNENARTFALGMSLCRSDACNKALQITGLPLRTGSDDVRYVHKHWHERASLCYRFCVPVRVCGLLFAMHASGAAVFFRTENRTIVKSLMSPRADWRDTKHSRAYCIAGIS